MKSCVSPTGLDHCNNRWPFNWFSLSPGRTSVRRTENVCQTTKYPKCGTQSACRVQTKSVFGNFRSLGGWTLGSTNVKGGLHSLSSQAHSRWRPFLDLSKPNLSETIRTSLQQGEWVTSIDFKDTYFHIPIQEQSRKYLRFHIQGRASQFKALPFGLPTAPMESTAIPKEVKLMAIHKDLRIHQYLDDWLVRARSHQACLQHTQELVNNVSATGLAGELREIRAGAQTRLRFCRLPVRPQV